jgi:hypothetical protein
VKFFGAVPRRLRATLYAVIANPETNASTPIPHKGKPYTPKPFTVIHQPKHHPNTLPIPAAGLSALQLILVGFSFERLYGLNFITITPLSFFQCLIFAVAFMLIRKHYSGIWY